YASLCFGVILRFALFCGTSAPQDRWVVVYGCNWVFRFYLNIWSFPQASVHFLFFFSFDVVPHVFNHTSSSSSSSSLVIEVSEQTEDCKSTWLYCDSNLSLCHDGVNALTR